MHIIDWCIVISFLLLIALPIYKTKRLATSVADFLAANRTVGRYLLLTSMGAAGIGAISIIAMFEVYYEAGFTAVWWETISLPMTVIIGITGWAIYRFRETKAMTLGQFFEMRYSRNFRIFAGALSFLVGIINFGIFPAVGTRFFIYYCGLPQDIVLLGFQVSTFAVSMFILLGISLCFALIGGQIGVILTDFIQGVFVSVVFVLIAAYILFTVGWEHIVQVAEKAPENASLANPYKTTGAANFNPLYFLISIFGMWYFMLAWQGMLGYDNSAKSPHEARMAKMLVVFREMGQKLAVLLIPICAYTLMHHEDFSSKADYVRNILATIDGTALQRQLTVPIAIRTYLPLGLKGAFCAIMLSAFVGNHATYMHSWGSIFIQDVVTPLRRTALSTKDHLRYLRLSICSVAVFVFIFSLVFQQTVLIVMFFAITGAIYLAGAGSVVIGGLYWKRGTTSAAWAAMITGAVLGGAGTTIISIKPDLIALTCQEMMFVACLCSIAVYVTFSLLSGKIFNLAKMLHRDEISEQNSISNKQFLINQIKAILPDKEFSRGDKIIYSMCLMVIFGWLGIFITGTVCSFSGILPDGFWFKYWHIYVWTMLSIAGVTTVWFIIGAIGNFREMFARLRTMKRDFSDNGTVRHQGQTKEYSASALTRSDSESKIQEHAGDLQSQVPTGRCNNL